MENHKQFGAALITALVITAIVATIATVIFLQQRLDIHQTELMINADRGYLYLVGAQNWAVSELTNDFDKMAKDPKLIELFPRYMPPTKFQRATITAALSDQQARFNINTLSNSNNQIKFESLLQAVDPKLTQNQRIQLAKNVTDWLTASSADTAYTHLKPPYLAAKRPMSSISELRLILGFNAELFNKLKSFIAALPNDVNKINANNASAQVLTTLSSAITLAKARTIIICRNNMQYFKSSKDFNSCLSEVGIKDNSISSNVIYNGSSYFLLCAQAILGKQQLNLYMLLQRTPAPSTKSAKIYPWWQTFGSM